MSLLTDMLAALDRWGEWKRMREAPGRVDDLERRLAVLEAKPKAAAGKSCPACGEPAKRRTGVRKDPGPFGLAGGKLEKWTCGECGDTEEIAVDR